MCLVVSKYFQYHSDGKIKCKFRDLFNANGGNTEQQGSLLNLHADAGEKILKRSLV